MMRDARFADGKAIGDLAGGHVFLPQQFKNPSAGRVVQRFKKNVHYFDI